MDNQNTTPPKFLTGRTILIILGLVIVGEIIWAAMTLFKGTPTPPLNNQQAFKKTPTAISLQTSNPQVKVGEKFTVSINFSSNTPSDGTDLIVLYDPALLSVIAPINNEPVALGTLYNDYPINKLEANLGKITVSGVSNKIEGSVPNGLFGKIEFQAKSAGISKIRLDFTPERTVDTNVIESATGKDVLEKVNDVEVNILP